MQPREFATYHLPGLERDEAKHSIILAVLDRLAGETPPEMQYWSLGEPGQCAIKAPGYPIGLGELTADQCRALAASTVTLDYPGVVGADDNGIDGGQAGGVQFSIGEIRGIAIGQQQDAAEGLSLGTFGDVAQGGAD